MSKGGNPFEDLDDDVNEAEQLAETQDSQSETTPIEQDSPPQETTDQMQEPESQEEASIEETQPPSQTVGDSSPGFPYSDVNQVQIYIREHTENDLDDLKYEVEGYLRRAHDIRNPTTRELDEAIIAVLVEQLSPERIATQLIRNRGYKSNKD